MTGSFPKVEADLFFMEQKKLVFREGTPVKRN